MPGTGNTRRLVLKGPVSLEFGENESNAAEVLTITPASAHPLALHRFKLVEGKVPRAADLSAMHRLCDTITRIAAGYEKNFGAASNRFIAVVSRNGDAVGAAVREVPDDASEETIEKAKLACIEGALRHAGPDSFCADIVVNFELWEEAAYAFRTEHEGQGKRVFNLVLAPFFHADALAVFRRGGACRMLENEDLARLSETSVLTGSRYFDVLGALVVEQVVVHVPLITDGPDEHLRIWGDPERIAEKRRDLVLCWAVGSSARSNSLTVVYGETLAANAAGEPSTDWAAQSVADRLAQATPSVPHKGVVAYFDDLPGFVDKPTSPAPSRSPRVGALYRLKNYGIDTVLAPTRARDYYNAQFAMNEGLTLITYPSLMGGASGHRA